MDRLAQNLGYALLAAMALLTVLAIYQNWRERGGSLDDLSAVDIARAVKESTE